MINKGLFLSPEYFGILYRIIGMILLWLLWIGTGGSTVGFFYLLFLALMLLLRWRFPKLCWSLIFDQIACVLVLPFWELAAYSIPLFVFDSLFFSIPWISLPAAVFPFLFRQDYVLSGFVVQSFFVGTALWQWKRSVLDAFSQMDQDRKKRHELEVLKDELLAANIQVAQMAEISERSRIAREIHDHAGHEIIAAYMSLQVVACALGNQDPQTKEMFHASMERLENGIHKIRESVHDLAPLATIGIDALKKLCAEFHFCSMAMHIYGDTSKVPVYLWSILEPCLKEALTNIIRHTEATYVNVTLDITPFILRLCVENDGVQRKATPSGIGLRNLRYRAMAVGGNVSTDQSDVFRLICVLPISKKGVL